MSKKIIYFNSQTNEEVHFGECITYKQSGSYENGGEWEKLSTVPVINSTIPILIKKGILVQKEVDDCEGTPCAPVEERIKVLEDTVIDLRKQIDRISKFLFLF